MKPFILPMAILIGLQFSSCTRITGEGPIAVETRATVAFSAIRTACDADVFVVQDSITKVEVHAQQNILSVLNTSVSGGELKIDFDYNKRVATQKRVEVYISCPDIRKLSTSGSGNIMASGITSEGTIALQVSGSGSIQAATVAAAGLSAAISGSGDISVASGYADNINSALSGSGSVDMAGVQSNTASLNTSGSGTTKLGVTDFLNVQLSGSGDIFYKGTPVISKHLSGSGKLIRL
ncbi:head GIN domain-containing protein [Rurimicrobium arvi]